MPEGAGQGWNVYKSDTNQMDVLQMLCLWCASRSKVPLACVWHKERFYTAGPVPCSGVGDLADGMSWISVVLSWNGFTILTHVIFPAFELSTNVP